MTADLPSSRAVADAVTHYRQIRQLTRDELSYVLSMNGYDLTTGAIRGIEHGAVSATVDDLVALAYALDVSAATLLSHIPITGVPVETPLATGVPWDVAQPELRAWLEGRTDLDNASRIRWCQEYIVCLRIVSTHFEDQLRGARDELDDLGELAVQEADSPVVGALHSRIRAYEYELSQADTALAYVELRLDRLRGVEH